MTHDSDESDEPEEDRVLGTFDPDTRTITLSPELTQEDDDDDD